MKKKRILQLILAAAMTLTLVACQNENASVAETQSDSVITQQMTETITADETFEVENETNAESNSNNYSDMDFWRSILMIKGEQITFPCTYAELDAALGKHGIIVKPTGCWEDENPDDRDTCFVDLYDEDTYFMAMTGTCEDKDDLESYIFDGTTVTEMAKDYISINDNKIGDKSSNINYDNLANETYRGETSIMYIIEDEYYEGIVSFRCNDKNDIISSFSIGIKEK